LNFPRLPYWCKPALDIQKSVLHWQKKQELAIVNGDGARFA
jgi:hypothetical protein